ncbi:hypothetical protein [Micromonospora radicis]|uniref:Uncharacterized protein n=1 Tax=Micromonospora radicis TaxID=1894971 RepID=A0A418N0T6_9ACTN|nr:hypothetical protein [Micromonospora radicis]RIV40798.1 hypothetical protein D2L64_04150 [Micromonospora radicis]
MTNRILSAVVLLTAAAALSACGGDPDRPPAAGPAAPPSAGPTGPTPELPPGPPENTTAAPADPATAPTATAPVGGATAPAAPSAGSSAQRLPLSAPPVELPPRQAGAPSARDVVAAFRKAGLKAGNSRDRAVECGPDGLGLGCSELVVTDGVAVYVFPDESSADDMAQRWTGASYRSGTVVLNYLEAPTPKADRPRYEKVLAGLR